jgi:hypothetical protein
MQRCSHGAAAELSLDVVAFRQGGAEQVQVSHCLDHVLSAWASRGWAQFRRRNRQDSVVAGNSFRRASRTRSNPGTNIRSRTPVVRTDEADWGARTPKGATCQTARPARQRDLPDSATCQTARPAEQRGRSGMPSLERCVCTDDHLRAGAEDDPQRVLPAGVPRRCISRLRRCRRISTRIWHTTTASGRTRVDGVTARRRRKRFLTAA